MYLRSLQVENYRAIRHASLTLENTTVLIGENDCGRTSIIEALMLLLGARDDLFEQRLRPIHFHRAEDGAAGPLRVRLYFREHSAGIWDPPEHVARALAASRGSRRQFQFTFEALLDSTSGRITARWFIAGSIAAGPVLENDSVLLNWIRTLVPVLWVRGGLTSVSAAEAVDGPGTDPALVALRRHYLRLVTGEAPDIVAELEEGARVARVVIDRYHKLFSGAAPMMGAMASDILKRQRAYQQADQRVGSAAQKIGMLLLLGSLLQLTARETRADSQPVLVLESPESNLHPMTVASVWRLVERITWQKMIATNSGNFLAHVPIATIRRLTRNKGDVHEWRVPSGCLSKDDLRRLAYHVRSRRGSAMFARCWLLVEGETEFWVMPELARVLGHDFNAEGIVPVEFAQCGLSPLIRLADRLGIPWLLLTDGDDAGTRYAATASALRHSDHESAIIQLRERDIELCFWQHGFDNVIRRVAFPGKESDKCSAKVAIRTAIERTSKPFLALSLIESAVERGPGSVPMVFNDVIDRCVNLARTSSPAG